MRIRPATVVMMVLGTLLIAWVALSARFMDHTMHMRKTGKWPKDALIRPSIDPIRKGLEHEGADIREAAVIALDVTGDPRAEEDFIRVLNNKTENTAVRIRAAYALKRIPGPRPMRALEKIKKDMSAPAGLRRAATPYDELYPEK